MAGITFDEFTRAVKQMHPDKASGPDGLNPAFFQNFWPSLGKEVYNSTKDWLKMCTFLAELNDTNIVLIPKKESDHRMRDLKAIALCNVLYNILAKYLANELSILSLILSQRTSPYLSREGTLQTTCWAFEVLHHMKWKHGGYEGEVALNLDINKAYDCIEWGYLKKRMQQMGFCEDRIKWILLCVTTVQYSMCFSGTQLGSIKPRCDLRQDDPLSSYLFLLCAEVRSCSLKRAEENGSIHGCNVSSTAFAITHLLFADDSILLFCANSDEAQRIKNILNTYELHSGQVVNNQKLAIFYSSNVHQDCKNAISGILGIWNNLATSKYLGLSSLIGRSKKSMFNFFKEKVGKKLQSWGNQLISRAGKVVLIKNVAQTIPSYIMSYFLLPRTTC